MKVQSSLLMIAAIVGAAVFSPAASASGSSSLALGHNHTCAISENKILCWGSNHYGQLEVPETLQEPRKIDATDQNTCALDLFYVTCWGIDGLDLFPVVEGKQLAVGGLHVCVLDKEGLWCYRGSNTFGELEVPSSLKNVSQIAAGQFHNCALDGQGVQCWGSDFFGQSSVPFLDNPVQITAGGNFSCALEQRGVICWGDNTYGQTVVPTLLNPVYVKAGYSHACAIDDGGVVCWGRNSFNQADALHISDAVEVVPGTHHTCGRGGEGVVCWGYNAQGQVDVPDELKEIGYRATALVSSTEAPADENTENESTATDVPVQTTVAEAPVESTPASGATGSKQSNTQTTFAGFSAFTSVLSPFSKISQKSYSGVAAGRSIPNVIQSGRAKVSPGPSTSKVSAPSNIGTNNTAKINTSAATINSQNNGGKPAAGTATSVVTSGAAKVSAGVQALSFSTAATVSNVPGHASLRGSPAIASTAAQTTFSTISSSNAESSGQGASGSMVAVGNGKPVSNVNSKPPTIPSNASLNIGSIKQSLCANKIFASLCAS